MMKIALLLVAFFACSFALTDREYFLAFTKFKAEHGKQYDSNVEHNQRFEIFRANLDRVNKHNAANKGFTIGINKFSDQSSEEFTRWACGMDVTKTTFAATQTEVVVGAPKSWDWRSHGAVTHIKNQGQCGSCWSFSSTGSMEGAHYLATKKLVSLSEQNLIDCSTAQGNQGCNGGLMDQAFEYVISNKGIDTEESYPYTATGPNTCRYNKAHNATAISSYHDIPSGDENALLNAVLINPVSVAIDASHDSFQSYTGGVYYEPECSSQQLDHGVLLVGYGTESGSDYWLVKNSWGTSWGIDGYIKMARNKNNNCGIASSASYPIV
eukprot:TRINITY_DN198_c0_g1_i1.p2 TRINITY_DN198_c0_g1~~TRINITY_DN198_c0_g1_i1.p2  ORF type:complete len:325 (+),score=81.65 TRINITY_DN198_c0_g1_i1:1-975(+)